MQVTDNPVVDALLSDICIGTSAAPTFLPAYYFKNSDAQGNEREFNLIDGGIAANNPVISNPTLIALLPLKLTTITDVNLDRINYTSRSSNRTN